MLFNIKNNVMMIRSELAEVQKQMRYEADTIHVLKAELSYLASPDRLKRLNGEYLKLKDTKVAQMIQDPMNDKVVYKTLRLSSKKSASGNSNWRYKKGPSKYLTLASGKK
jgi:hypothetical protein